MNMETYREIYSLGYFLSYLGALTVCRKLGLSDKRICLPTQEKRVQSPGQEDLLEEEMTTHFSILVQYPLDREAWWTSGHGVAKSQT